MEAALGTEGLTLGVALARADSTPMAEGTGAGQCSLLGDEPDPDNLPCNESTASSSSYPGEPGTPQEQCAGPGVPAPLSTILSIGLACGASHSGVTGGLPFTANSGKVAEIALELDLRGLVPQVEDAKEQVIDALQDITNQAPEPIKNALNSVLDALDAGQGGRILVGPSSSNVTKTKDGLEVVSSAAGARIGVLGIPDLDEDGVPILGTSDAIEDGLIIIEVGAAEASASLDLDSAAATSAADPALVTVKIRDITQAEPTYISQSVAPGQTQTILAGTPLESTITAAASTTEVEGNTARAAADAVRLHLLKGVQGGILVGLGRATASAAIDKVLPAPPIKRGPPDTLPVTGGRDLTVLALALLLISGALLIARRRAG